MREIFARLCIGFMLALLMSAHAQAQGANASVLFGWNGSGTVPIEVTSDGSLKMNANINESSGIMPLSNDSGLIGNSQLIWANFYARNISSTGAALSLFAGGSERVTITAGGSVGIGIATPQQTLEVAGTINATGKIFLNGSTVIRNVAYTWPSADGGANQLLTTNGAGVLSWAPLSGTNLSGGGATNRLVKWQNTTHFTNSVVTDDGTNVGVSAASPVEKLDVRGNINVSGTVNASKIIGEGAVPAGMMMFFNATTCPTGWVNFTDVRGRAIVGMPAGGTLRGTSGSALSDNGTVTITTAAAHTHSVDPPATTSSSDGSHTHSADPPATTSSSDGSHTHSADPPATTSGTSSHTHTADPASVTTSTNGAHKHTIGRAGNTNSGGGLDAHFGAGTTPTSSSSGSHSHSVDIAAVTSGAEASHTHTTDIGSFDTASGGGHTHTTDIASFTSGSGGGGTHTTDIASFTTGSTGSASVDVTMPYIQLLGCIKT